MAVAGSGRLRECEGRSEGDPQRGDLVRKAFELVATRSYGLEEVLRRITVLGLVTKRGRSLTKQTLSQVLRNQLYAGWVVSGDNKVKGIHEPLVSQSLFDAVQDALDGKKSAPVVHKTVNPEFPLKGFVRCAGCEKKLTAGFVKGRRRTRTRATGAGIQSVRPESARAGKIEGTFLRILSLMVPTQELINRLPEIAKTYWVNGLGEDHDRAKDALQPFTHVGRL